MQECLASSDRFIALRAQHQLLAARAELLVCASATCPAEIREECGRRIDEINAAIPSVAFYVKNGDGKDLSAVRVTMDGAVLAERLTGAAFSVDPGAHAFVFESANESPVREDVILVEGMKDRHVTVTLGRPTPKPVADEPPKEAPGGTQRLLGWTAVGAGVIGAGVGLVFLMQRSSKISEYEGICPGGTCEGMSEDEAAAAQARIDQLEGEAQTAGTISAVGFIAGGVLAAGGLALVFTAPSRTGEVAFVPLVAPGLQGLVATGSF